MKFSTTVFAALLCATTLQAQTKKTPETAPAAAQPVLIEAQVMPSADGPGVEAPKIAVPVAAAATKGMPKMTFQEKTSDFGKVKTGDLPSHTFEFQNTGNADLDIELVSGCDCTEIVWTTTTVKAGEKGFVKATFNTKRAEPEDHKKPLKKDLTIILKQTYPQNDYPIVEELFFTVEITD